MKMEPSALEKAMSSQDVMKLVKSVSVYLRSVPILKKLHRDDCESEANVAVVIALRDCPDAAGLLTFAKLVAERSAMKLVNRDKKFVTLDAEAWHEVDEASPVEHDAYADGDLKRLIRDNYTAEEMLDVGVGYQKTAELTETPERRIRHLHNRKHNNARTKIKSVTEHLQRQRAPMS